MKIISKLLPCLQDTHQKKEFIQKPGGVPWLAVLKMVVLISTRLKVTLTVTSFINIFIWYNLLFNFLVLLKDGWDPNFLLQKNQIKYKDKRRSILYFAAHNDDFDCVDLLLKYGAKVDLDPLKVSLFTNF